MAKPGPISAKPLSVLLSDVFSDAYAKQGFAARELVTRWSEIAGPEIAAHSEPLKIQWPRPVEGQKQEPATLVLRVEGPMALEIQHASDVVLQRVNRFFGWSAVGRLALRQAPLSRRGRVTASRAPDPNSVAKVAETLTLVEDEELRAGIGVPSPAHRIRSRWRKSPNPCPRSRTRNCAPRWRGSARRSSEIEPAAGAGGGW
jgi:hypothetical protein